MEYQNQQPKKKLNRRIFWGFVLSLPPVTILYLYIGYLYLPHPTEENIWRNIDYAFISFITGLFNLIISPLGVALILFSFIFATKGLIKVGKTGEKGYWLGLFVYIIIIFTLFSYIYFSDYYLMSSGKSPQAVVKASLNNIRAQIEIVAQENNGSYDVICENENIKTALHASTDAFDELRQDGQDRIVSGCSDSRTEWVAWHALNREATKFYCVDSNRNATTTSVNLSALNPQADNNPNTPLCPE